MSKTVAEYGLLGRNLKYSYSKKIHEAFGLYDYELIEREPEDLPYFFSQRKFKGLNVTIPYKETVMKYCDKVSYIAERIGAVNTIYEFQGQLIGDNTDYYGFIHTLNLLKADVKGKRCLVLGRGGAAKCVRLALLDKGALKVVLTSREDLKDLSAYFDFEIIVNASPLGTKGISEDKSPCDLKNFKNAEYAVDLVYNPKNTVFLKQARELNIKCIGGYPMLKAQAEKSARRFMKSKTLVLIGMPGCGKSRIARGLAKKTGRKAFDTDSYIKQNTGKYPSEIIKESGVFEFRKIESRALKELLKNEGSIIATGGGIVTVKENKALLDNCISVWIKRDLNCLTTANRPLSKDVYKLYEEREPLYEDFSDITVYNNEDAACCIKDIKRICKI